MNREANLRDRCGVELGISPNRWGIANRWCGRVRAVFFGAVAVLAAGGGSTASAQSKITISPVVPDDIPGGAPNASLFQAGLFAWQEFIALNWPAVPQTGARGDREKPDTSKKFGDPTYKGPLVWETYRHKVEIFPGDGRQPPGFTKEPPLPSAPTYFGYDYVDPTTKTPVYNYQNPIPFGGPGAAPASSWINLDEVSQIGLNQIYSGVTKSPPAPGATNTQPRLIRFLAKANRTYYNYIAKKNYWNHGGNYNDAQNVFKQAIAENVVPKAGSIVNLPNQKSNPLETAGTIELKSGWRLLGAGEDASKFHTQTVQYYEKKGEETVFYQETWGLIALHIIHKTPTAPAFIFASFEQTDNIVDASGVPLEDATGALNPAAKPAAEPMSPNLTYSDADGKIYDPANPSGKPGGPPGPFIAVAGPLIPPDRRLYYQNAENTGLPHLDGKTIAVNQRLFPIPEPIVRINKHAHDVIQGYNAQAVWLNYKLVNVQYQPYDLAQIDAANPNRLPSTYYMANSVVETNNTLQQFFGRQIGLLPGGLTPKNPQSGSIVGFKSALGPGGKNPFYNVYVPAQPGKSFNKYRMGGCMGCHGNAQVQGSDFSFLLNFGGVLKPDVPATDPKHMSNRFRGH